MSKHRKKSKNSKPSNNVEQHPEVIIRRQPPGREGPLIELSCRRIERDDDSICVTAYTSTRQAQISITLEEAESFFEQAMLLVSDEKEQPIGGSIFLDTRAGETGARISFTVDNPESYNANVEVADKSGRVCVSVDRGALERFLFAATEGICQDLEDDD